MPLLLLLWSPLALAWTCPEGLRPFEVVQEGGRERACLDAQGQRQGPSELRDFDGVIRERGSWADGVRSGRWRLYDASGRPAESGEMAAGRRAGAWSTFDAEQEIVATVTWTAPRLAPDADDPSPDDPVAAWPEPVAPRDPRVHWRLHLAGTARQIVPVGDLALVERGGAMWGVGLDDGELRWKAAFPGTLRPGLVMGAGQAAAVTGSGEVWVVDLDTGATHRIRTNLGATHAAWIDADRVVVRDGAGRIEALDPRSGRSLWRHRLSMNAIAPAVGMEAVAAVRGREVRALDLVDGGLAWQTRLRRGAALLAPSWDGGRIWALDGAGGLTVLGAVTGRPLAEASIDGLAGRAPGAVLRGDEDAFTLTTPDALRAFSLEGAPLDALPLPPDAVLGGDLLGDRACFGTQGGSLTCASLGSGEVSGSLEVGPLAHPPVVLGETVLVATADGLLRAVHAPALRPPDALGAGLEELHPALPLVVDWVQGPVALEGTGATAPLVLRSRATADRPGCTTDEALLDLQRIESPEVPELPSDEGPHRIAIPELTLSETSLDPPATFDAERWEVQDRFHRWSLSYWTEWRPSVLEMGALGGDPEVAARIDRLLSCDSGAARFEGTALLQDGPVQRRIGGRMRVTPIPHSLDGEPGCLVDLSVSGEPLGTWAVPALPGWVELTLSATDEDGGDVSELALPLPGEAGPPEDPVDGDISLDLLERGAQDRAERWVDGPVDILWTSPGSPSAHPEAADLVFYAAGVEQLRVPADGLLYADLGVHPDGEEGPVVEWTTSHTLLGREGVRWAEQPMLPVWSATRCEDAGGVEDGAPVRARPLLAPEPPGPSP